jgi:hypothetical protein
VIAAGTSVLERITIDPNVGFGKPCVRGTRITVGDVLGYLAGPVAATSSFCCTMPPKNMRMLIVTWAIVFWQTAASFGPPRWEIAGRVTDPAGAPLAGVRIIDGIQAEVATGSDGRYAVHDSFGQLRFLKSGYRPVTKVMERSGALDVVLEPTTEAPWSPPLCAAKPRGKRIGGRMQFTVPEPLRVQRGRDIDYSTASIVVRGASMQFGAGPLWSYGFAPSQTLAEMVSVEEREVTVPGDGFAVTDYRGVRADGSRWRTLVTFGESITYDRADTVAAKLFDEVLASLCFAKPAVP